MDVDDPTLKHCPARRRMTAGRKGVVFCDFDELGRGAVYGFSTVRFTMLPDDEPRFCARKLHGAFDQTIQYCLKIESRAADGLENPGGRGFSSMCLRQLSLQLSIRAGDALRRLPGY